MAAGSSQAATMTSSCHNEYLQHSCLSPFCVKALLSSDPAALSSGAREFRRTSATKNQSHLSTLCCRHVQVGQQQ